MILVEGESDRVALETLAERLRLPPPEVVVLGGAHAVRRARLDGDPIALCDERESPVFVTAGVRPERVFVCRADLEDELIRALDSAQNRFIGLEQRTEQEIGEMRAECVDAADETSPEDAMEPTRAGARTPTPAA